MSEFTYSCANHSIQRDKWDALPRMQLVLASAGLADRPDGKLSSQSVHNWLSVPPLTVAAVTNKHTNTPATATLAAGKHVTGASFGSIRLLTSYTCACSSFAALCRRHV